MKKSEIESKIKRVTEDITTFVCSANGKYSLMGLIIGLLIGIFKSSLMKLLIVVLLVAVVVLFVLWLMGEDEKSGESKDSGELEDSSQSKDQSKDSGECGTCSPDDKENGCCGSNGETPE